MDSVSVISLNIGTEEHGGTTSKDIETSTLFLNQTTTFVAKPISLSLSTNLTLFFHLIH